MAEHPFAFTGLAVGGPENSTQQYHKPQRQKQIGQDQIPSTVEYGARGNVEGPQADYQEACQEGKDTENETSVVTHPCSVGTQSPDPATSLLPLLRENAH